MTAIDMTDGFVQVAVDGAGKKVDNTEVTRSDLTVVERQRVEAHDEDDEVLSTAAVVEELKNIGEKLDQLMMLIKLNNEIWISIAKG